MSERRRTAARTFALLALAVPVGLTANRADAQEQTKAPTIDIQWQAPQGCPSYADVSSWLDAVLPPEVKERLGSARAEVTLERIGQGFRATVRVRTPGEASAASDRTLEAAACEELARSAVIVVSVALTEAASAKPEAQPEPAPEPEPEPEPEPAASLPPPSQDAAPVRAPERTSAPADERAVRALSGALGPTAGLGDVTLRADVAFRWPVARSATLGARVRVVPHATVDMTTSGIDLLLVAPAPEACLVLRSSNLQFGGCARAELGLLRASGGGPTGSSDSALWSALGVLPFLEWGQDVRLLLAVDGDLRLLRPTLELDDGRVLKRLPRFSYAGLFGLGFTIP